MATNPVSTLTDLSQQTATREGLSKYCSYYSDLSSFNNVAADTSQNIPTSCTLIPTSSSSSSSPASIASNRRIWNFGRKKDIICDTVDAWSNSRSGKLFLNLKQSLFGHTNRTQRMMLIRGSKPLVFGGTYPIDVPMEGSAEELIRRVEEVMPKTFDIDAPCIDSVTRASLIGLSSNVVRRNSRVSQQRLTKS